MLQWLDVCVCFFFSSRRRHTRFDCDWSSDVCSSDLASAAKCITASILCCLKTPSICSRFPKSTLQNTALGGTAEIGRASCREKSVDLGGRRIIKKKKIKKNKTDTAVKEIIQITENTL